ncbi:MAG: DUF3572 domain-containing protein [Rhizomicrobium sp.]
MKPQIAQTLALKALGFIADSDGALERLMEQSGLDLGALRKRAGDSDMLASILDFLLADEDLLVGFCGAESLDPRQIHLARHVLGGA